MRRRHFLTRAAVLPAGALAAPALAQAPTLRWRMAASWPKNLDALYGSASALCDRVSQLTEGRFQIQPFAAGEIVGALQVFDATSNGTVECSHTLSSYFIGKDPVYAFDGGLPFGLNTRQQQAWMHSGGGLQLVREVFRKSDIIPFPVGNVGVQMGGWFRREVNTVEDLKGLKFRIGGFGGIVLSKLGAVPQQIPAGDIYSSLERGTIDAAEWIGPYDDEKLGFVRVAPYYYTPGWWEGSTQITSFVNAKAWDALPPLFKAAFEVASNEQNVLMMAKYDAGNPQALRRLVRAGAQVKAFSRPMMEACYKASQETFEEIAAKNEDFRRLLQSWRAFADDSNLWFRVAELNLDAFRFAPARAPGPAPN